MLDINYLEQHIQEIKILLKNRVDINQLDNIIAINAERKKSQLEADELRNKRNTLSKEIGMKKSQGNLEEAEKLLEEAEQIKNYMVLLEEQQKSYEEQLKLALEVIPNIPMRDVPEGKDEHDNIEMKKWGTPREWTFPPLSHVDILTNLHMWEPERAANISGKGFPMLRNAGARLETALINFMLDHNISCGAEQLWVPFAISENALYGTGQLPKFQEDLFQIKDSDLYLNPTAEVALTNVYREEIVEHTILPARFTAYSPSFRKEAGSYGKDTKGLIRVHQFNKVELVTICKPEESVYEHQRMLETSEKILQLLELPYRVITLCQGDMGFSAAKTYDIEVWLPSFDSYKEIASISNCLDFQARRANIRYKPENSKKTNFVHTLNGSALAVGRTLVAIVENYQQEDGSIMIPKALYPYFKQEKIN